VYSDRAKEVAVAYSFADSAYHFYDSTVIWNWQDKYAVVERNSSFGSMVLMGLGFSENEDLKLSTPGNFIVPLSKQIKSPGEVKWTDLLTTNNPTFSPDGKYVAMEVYPPPMDLKRFQSRIYIYEFPSENEAGSLEWFWLVGVFKGPGRRLTAITGENCELMPL